MSNIISDKCLYEIFQECPCCLNSNFIIFDMYKNYYCKFCSYRNKDPFYFFVNFVKEQYDIQYLINNNIYSFIYYGNYLHVYKNLNLKMFKKQQMLLYSNDVEFKIFSKLEVEKLLENLIFS